MKFRYGDKVKIKSGFFEGFSGVVVSYVESWLPFGDTKYIVSLEDINKHDWFSARNLEKEI